MTVRILAKAVGMLALAVVSTEALAVITSVTTTPATSNVPVSQGVTRTITWTVIRDNANADPTVASPQGQFVTSPGDQTLETVPTTLSQTQAIVGATTTFTFTETVRLPAAVVIRARQLGARAIVYERTFDDGFGAQTGFPTFALTGSAGGEFAIERLALRFDDDSAARVVSVDETLGAELEASFTGTGLLEGVWELADPASTSGEPVFRRLRTVHEPLLGGTRVTLDSPELPTERTGIHLLRFRVTEPEVGFAPLVIRYAVLRGERAPREAPPIDLTSPPDGERWSPETTFSWRAVRGANAYRLEVYGRAPDEVDYALPELGTVDAERRAARDEPRTLVTGMLLTGEETETALSGLARTRLREGRRYRWRVVAIGEDGRVVARSPLRDVWVP